MMIPEAWENHTEMDPERRAFYQFHASLMEPWDGPALIAFTDGTVIGAVLDRNGLRPGRYWVTDDGLVVLASEVGVLDIDPVHRPQGPAAAGEDLPGRHRPRAGSSRTTRSRPPWPPSTPTSPGCTPARTRSLPSCPPWWPCHGPLADWDGRAGGQQRMFGYTEEELRVILAPMAATGRSPSGRWGPTRRIAVLSDRSRLLYDYFTQLFAQVTNPPLDAIREELVTSLARHGRAGGQPARARPGLLPPDPAAAPGDRTRTTWPRSCTSTTTADLPGFASPSTGGRRRMTRAPRPAATAWQRAGEICAEVSAAIADGAQHHRPLRPQHPPRSGPDPVAAADRRRAPPPDPGEDPDPGRPGRRDRRRPRGATTWRCSSGYGAAASTRTWRSTPSRT
jgi:glutamate synthase (NADPH/NADH) large chain